MNDWLAGFLVMVGTALLFWSVLVGILVWTLG